MNNELLNKVLAECISTIYFHDRSDYLKALWTITRMIDPEAAALLEIDENEAVEKYTDLHKIPFGSSVNQYKEEWQ
jgi:hypothetical protein